MADRKEWWIRETNHGCDNAYRTPSDQHEHWENLVYVQAIDLGEDLGRPLQLAQEAYDAYCRATGGKSLVTGDVLPPFVELSQDIKSAWMISAAWVAGRTMRKMEADRAGEV